MHPLREGKKEKTGKGYRTVWDEGEGKRFVHLTFWRGCSLLHGCQYGGFGYGRRVATRRIHAERVRCLRPGFSAGPENDNLGEKRRKFGLTDAVQGR